MLTLILAMSAALTAAQSGPAAGATPAPSPPPTIAPAPGATPVPFALTVRGGILGTATLEARKVEAKGIIERLKTELKIPIQTSPIVSRRLVDLSLKQTSTFNVLLALAPVVLADLEVAPGEDPIWTALHLLAVNEKQPQNPVQPKGFLVFSGVLPGDDGKFPPPSETPVDRGDAKALDEEPKDDKPVLVVVATPDGRVSVKSRRQPLIAILNEVASRTGIPLDVRGGVDMTPIDVEIRDLPLRDLGVALGRTGYRVSVRRNLATQEEWVQGILIGESRPPGPVR